MNNKNSSDGGDRIKISLPLNKKLLKYVFFITLIIAVAYTVVTQPQKLMSILDGVLSIMSPFIIGFCAAYVLNLVLRPLERFWLWAWRKNKNQKIVERLKRPICLTFSFLIVIGAIFAVVFMIIPAFKETVVSFADKVPQYAKTVEGWYYTVVDFFEQYNFSLPEISLNTDNLTQIAKDIINNYGSNVLDTTVNFTASIAAAVVNVALGLVFAIYLLAQKEKLANQVKKVLAVIMKPKRAQRLMDVTALTNNIFTKFITGQFADACIIGALCFIGMLILGMPYAAIISVLIGFTALIPVFGAFIGAGLGAFLILLESPAQAFWFLVFLVILQQLEGNLIYPRVVGKSVGLPGIWVLVSVTIGGSLFGVMGMLFSVPVCTIMYVMFRKFIRKKTAQDTLETEDNFEPSKVETTKE